MVAKKPTWKEKAEQAEASLEEARDTSLRWQRLASTWRDQAIETQDDLVNLRSRIKAGPAD